MNHACHDRRYPGPMGGTLAGLCPDVPEEYPLNLPGRLACELVESVPQVVIVRGVRAKHHYRGVPVP
jgi:hypothetical protein